MKHLTLFVALVALTCVPALAQKPDGGRPAPILTRVFEQDRLEGEDVILFRNKDVLRGEVLNESVALTTQYGVLSIPLDRCAAISFEGARANTEAVVTKDFNRMTGIITDRHVSFRIGSSGTVMKIRKEKIRFIMMRRGTNSQEAARRSADGDLFLMANGDLLTGEAFERQLSIRTDDGIVPVAFEEMADVQMQGGDNVTAIIQKVNGDSMRGTLETEELTLRLDLGIEIPAIYKDKFARVYVDGAQREAAGQFGVMRPISGESAGALIAGQPGEVRTNSIGVELRHVAPGRFRMGSAFGDDDEQPAHDVELTQAFYLGTTEVTQAQWAAVMGTNPSAFKGETRPVENVSWEDAVRFCAQLTDRERASGELGQDWKYSLPTEAQWEYACRAGTATAYSFGDATSDLNGHAWWAGNSDGETHPVGRQTANLWGLQDMHGNVWEWCLDWYDSEFYGSSEASVDPTGPSSGSYRVARGGGCYSGASYLRSADRDGDAPGRRNRYLGFRLAMVPSE